MYLGAALALLGAAVFFRSLALAGFVTGFLVVTHLFVVLYEEPALKRLFGSEYIQYRARVWRWLPRRA
jgi:protein-S-isoprenylcysteine O-methyltransferase Ste14